MPFAPDPGVRAPLPQVGSDEQTPLGGGAGALPQLLQKEDRSQSPEPGVGSKVQAVWSTLHTGPCPLRRHCTSPFPTWCLLFLARWPGWDSAMWSRQGKSRHPHLVPISEGSPIFYQGTGCWLWVLYRRPFREHFRHLTICTFSFSFFQNSSTLICNFLTNVSIYY